MKVVTFGKKSRYAIILMKENAKGESIDNTITYYNEDNLDALQSVYDSLYECQRHHYEKHDGIYLNISAYDYQEARYITKRLRGY